MELKKYLFAFILFLALAGCAKDKSNINDDDKIIAKIGKDYEVTFSDLKKYVTDWNYNKRFRDKSEAYKNALDALIINQLKRFDFFDRKLNENQDLLRKIRPSISFALINTYFDKEFVSKYVDEKNAAEAYKEMDKEVTCNDILLPFSQNLSKDKIDSLKALALEIQKGVILNYGVNELRKAYSLKNPVINVKKLSWSQSLSDPVASAAFKMQNGDTRVVQSYDGFHIIII